MSQAKLEISNGLENSLSPMTDTVLIHLTFLFFMGRFTVHVNTFIWLQALSI